MTTHGLTIRVYYEDTDFSQNVYHAAYLHFFERGRTEFLRDLGVHHSELIREGIAFAVRSMSIDFKAAAHIDDELEVVTEVASATAAAAQPVAGHVSGPEPRSPGPRCRWWRSGRAAGWRACPRLCWALIVKR